MKAFNNFIRREDVQLFILYIVFSSITVYSFFSHYDVILEYDAILESIKTSSRIGFDGDKIEYLNLNFNKIYQLFSLFISSLLAGIFILLGRSNTGNKVDPGYTWLAIAMYVWQVSACIILIHGSSNKTSEIRFLLSMANSFSLLLALPYFNFLKEYDSTFFKLVNKSQLFLDKRYVRDVLKLFFVFFSAAIVFKLTTGNIENTFLIWDQQMIKISQLIINIWVSIIIPATLWFIFRERDIWALNLLSIMSFSIVVIYEGIEYFGYSTYFNFPFDSNSLMFAYKIFLFIIFFSLSVSYRVYANKKQIVTLEDNVKEQKEQLSDLEIRERESKQQLQIFAFKEQEKEVKSPIERFLYSFLVVIKSHHGAQGTDEEILGKGNYASEHHTFHGGGWKIWQQQSFYPSLQDLMQEKALETNTKGFDDAMNSVFKSICYRSLNMNIIIYLMWVCLRRRGNINDSESAITQSEYCLEHLIKLESNYNILDTYFWKDYQQVLQSMYAFFYAILFKQKTNDCILEAIEIEERKFLLSVSIGEKNIENLLAKIDSKSKPRTGDTAIHLFDLNASLKDKATVHLSVSHSNKQILNVNIIKNEN